MEEDLYSVMVSTAAHDAGDPGSNPLAATHSFINF